MELIAVPRSMRHAMLYAVVLATTAWPADGTAQARRGQRDTVEPSTLEDPRLARCEENVRRTFRRSPWYTDMQFAADANVNEPEEAKPRGKFTPRHPIDVELILKLPIEVLMKKTNEWKPAELWCGIAGGRLIAGDIVERNAPPPK
jgi:hypothetical protein